MVPAVIVMTAVNYQKKPVKLPGGIKEFAVDQARFVVLANQPIMAQLCPMHKTTVA